MKPRYAARVWIALSVSLCLWLRAHAVRAEPVDPARSASARALFEQGVAHVDRDEWGAAAEAFRRALSLRDSQVIRYNLASALVELGKLVEASELLHIVQADAHAATSLQQQAAEKLAEIEPRIARVTIHTEAAALPELVVELDDLELGLTQFDLPLSVDPGKHVVRARLAGELIDEQSTELSEGGAALINLRAPPPKAPPAPSVAAAPSQLVTPVETARLALAEPAPSAPPPVRDGEPETPSRKKLWWGIAVGGVGAVAFVTLVALFVPRHTKTGAGGGDFDPPSVAVQVPQ
jgi:hypothetical protein